MQRKASIEWDDLETFEDVGLRLGKPYVAIDAIGIFRLNSSFKHHARVLLKGQTHIKLSYSKKNQAIVFEFTDDANERGAIKMTGRGNISISARSFFSYHGLIPADLKGRYVPQLLKVPKKGNCWVVFHEKKN